MVFLQKKTRSRHHLQENYNQTQYTCRNTTLWQLHPKIEVLDLFEISNVVVYPSDLYSQVVFGIQSPSMLQEAENALISCIGKHSNRDRVTSVFFNCPCRDDLEPFTTWIRQDQDKYCPAHAKFISELRISHSGTTLDGVTFDNSTTTSVTNNSVRLFPPVRRIKDLLIVFNSWGSTSIYHVMFEVIFPLWSTVHRVVTIGGHPSSSVTLLNTSPSCPSEVHLHTVKPWVELLFGPDSYEITSGNISQSFGDISAAAAGTLATGNGTMYQHAVFGFAYPWRPHFKLGNNQIRFDPSVGQLFVSFAHDLRRKMYDKAVSSGINESTAKSLRLHLCDHPTTDVTMMQEQGAIIERVKDDGRRIDTNTLLAHIQQALTPAKKRINLTAIEFGIAPLVTFHEQAVAASSLSLIIGTEGAGFTQQLFLQPRSLLVIIHCPRPKGPGNGYVNGTKQFKRTQVTPWHHSVAQYLGHSVLNILPPICAELNSTHYHRIADSIVEVTNLHHKNAIPRQQTIDATVDVTSFWTRMVPFLSQLKVTYTPFTHCRQ